jgi:hypothetical protein
VCCMTLALPTVVERGELQCKSADTTVTSRFLDAANRGGMHCCRRSSKGHTVSHVRCNPAGTLAACAAGRTLHVFELAAEDLESKRWDCSTTTPPEGGTV